jgi:hypothetical protein
VASALTLFILTSKATEDLPLTLQAPWFPDETNKSLAYGFAGIFISGWNETDWCCACFELQFVDGPGQGKTMVVQAINTGTDLNHTQFDLVRIRIHARSGDACQLLTVPCSEVVLAIQCTSAAQHSTGGTTRALQEFHMTRACLGLIV